MVRLPDGKQRLGFGCYYNMKLANRGLAINMTFVIRWYAWPFLMWKTAHKEYVFKWYQYPWLLWLITKYSVMNWLGK